MDKSPRNTLRWIKSGLKRAIYSGNNRLCPVCGYRARVFLEIGVVPCQDARCPACNSLERHRLLWRYLQERTTFFQMTCAKMLHIAPEACLENRFRQQIGSGYLTGDLLNPADVKMDITDIQFPDNTFDVVCCSHVLEHVPDDRLAMQEFWRVLKPDGFAFLLVPITAERTVEDPTITDPQERLRLFGQDDHVRRYGPDYVDRLRDAGFAVKMTKAEDFLAPEEIQRIAVTNALTGEIYHCVKA